MKRVSWVIASVFALLALAVPASALAVDRAPVPGHERSDTDGNGIPDAGVMVNGHYTSLYAEDANGDYYWDLGDGRIYKTVDSIDDLDQATLTVCTYQNTYRADFGNTPFMDSGWIINTVTCQGYDPGTYNSVIVHESDPRYTGDPALAVPGWGAGWEYHVETWSGSGNQVRFTQPENHAGA